jgi:hypothetical protein
VGMTLILIVAGVGIYALGKRRQARRLALAAANAK